jgi:hypothetical protein
MSFGYTVLGFGSIATHAAAVTAGISKTLIDDDSSGGTFNGSAANFSDGDVIQISYSGSGGSTIAYTFAKVGGSAMAVGTKSDMIARNAMEILAWKGHADVTNGSAVDVTLSGTGAGSYSSVHTTLTESGTWYLKVTNETGSSFDTRITQDVDSSTATATDDTTILTA